MFSDYDEQNKISLAEYDKFNMLCKTYSKDELLGLYLKMSQSRHHDLRL